MFRTGAVSMFVAAGNHCAMRRQQALAQCLAHDFLAITLKVNPRNRNATSVRQRYVVPNIVWGLFDDVPFQVKKSTIGVNARIFRRGKSMTYIAYQPIFNKR
mmetsp:Transcript_6323/g.13016  ORF Transcript_6323/g.13016 Transcript_6323/m.13016 type:complete len:102 (-) Transcript_6323:1000-1305(-)